MTNNTYRISAVLIAGYFATACSATVYKDQDFSSYQSEHKKVALLPFDVSIDTKNLPKDTNLDFLVDAEKEEGYLFQAQLYTQFLNKYQKGEYTVSFQDVDETNVLLERAGVTYETLNSFTKAELAEILGVDSIISGDVKRSKPMGTAAAVASTFLVGFGATNKVVVNMTLHDGKTSSLLWSYDHQQAGGIASSPDRLAKNLMKNSSAKFPYESNR